MSFHKCIIPVLSALAVFLLFAECVEGVPIYSQVLPEEPVAAYTSWNTATSQKVADNFMVEGTGVYALRSLRFIGGYGENFPPPPTPPDALPPDNFRIVFLNDATGSPGSPIAGGDFSINSAFSRTPTGGRMLNGDFDPIQYVIDLGSGVSLDKGVVYWVSIANEPGPDHGWAWARANGVLDQELASTFSDQTLGPWNVFASGGMWFELNDQNIPEPSSLAILLAICSVVALRFQRRYL